MRGHGATGAEAPPPAKWKGKGPADEAVKEAASAAGGTRAVTDDGMESTSGPGTSAACAQQGAGLQALLQGHEERRVRSLVDGVEVSLSVLSVDVVSQVVQVVTAVLRNVCNHPTVPKYQSVSLISHRMAVAWQFASVKHLLEEMGFEATDDESHIHFKGSVTALQNCLPVLVTGLEDIVDNVAQQQRIDAAHVRDTQQRYAFRCQHCQKGIKDRVPAGDSWSGNTSWRAMEERELEYRYECATCKRSGLQVSLCEACHSRYLNGHHNVHSPDHVFEPIAPVTRFLTYGAAPAPPPPSVNRRGPFG
uniref:PUB domain-containing protein n=1 Tax=Eutreptiella gymnastica TaxID=73025 RepID=A0A7S4LNG0_9EUGL